MRRVKITWNLKNTKREAQKGYRNFCKRHKVPEEKFKINIKGDE